MRYKKYKLENLRYKFYTATSANPNDINNDELQISIEEYEEFFKAIRKNNKIIE